MGYFRSSLSSVLPNSISMSKLKNAELPNVGYFYYCVSTPIEILLNGLAACSYEEEIILACRSTPPPPNLKFAGHFRSLAERAEFRKPADTVVWPARPSQQAPRGEEGKGRRLLGTVGLAGQTTDKGAQMSDGRLGALIGMLSLKSKIVSSSADVWRAMQVYNIIKILWESKCKVKYKSSATI